MDWIGISRISKELFKKYKYVLLVLAVGVLLMLLPDAAVQPEQQEEILMQEETSSPADELEEILSQISGVGKVEVLLTEAAGAETVYQTNENCNHSNDSESIRTETVIISKADREETGLVRTVTPPVYLGAIIVCQGGDQPSVKLSVVQAVSSVTGISSDRIVVLKMK